MDSRDTPLDDAETARIQRKQGGHHMPARPDDGPPLDDTDRNRQAHQAGSKPGVSLTNARA